MPEYILSAVSLLALAIVERIARPPLFGLSSTRGRKSRESFPPPCRVFCAGPSLLERRETALRFFFLDRRRLSPQFVQTISHVSLVFMIRICMSQKVEQRAGPRRRTEEMENRRLISALSMPFSRPPARLLFSCVVTPEIVSVGVDVAHRHGACRAYKPYLPVSSQACSILANIGESGKRRDRL